MEHLKGVTLNNHLLCANATTIEDVAEWVPIFFFFITAVTPAIVSHLL